MVAPTIDSPWNALTPEEAATLLRGIDAHWWLSGGAAMERIAARTIRERTNIDISTTARDLATVVDAIPAHFSVWAPAGDDEGETAIVPWAERRDDIDLHPVRVYDDERGVWVLQINVEDGTDKFWVYKRDPRLTLPWNRAVSEIDGVPTSAPEVQLVWKALRPRPEDDADKDAVLPLLSDEARAWYERAILSIHPHSGWSIPVRTPMFPAKASWNRSKREH